MTRRTSPSPSAPASSRELVAHRGAKREQPENTLPAFRRALELGAHAIELDVHATADGVVVVHHDWVPMALTPSGEPAGTPIAECDWQSLRQLEVGPGVGIPTLREVLDLVGSSVTSYIELKGRDIEALVLEDIRQSGARCAVHSFDHAAIARASLLAPELPRGLLFDASLDRLEPEVRATGARDIWPHWSLVNEELVSRVHALGCRLVVWTVNDRDEAARLWALGADALCGDDVALLGAGAHMTPLAPGSVSG